MEPLFKADRRIEQKVELIHFLLFFGPGEQAHKNADEKAHRNIQRHLGGKTPAEEIVADRAGEEHCERTADGPPVIGAPPEDPHPERHPHVGRYFPRFLDAIDNGGKSVGEHKSAHYNPEPRHARDFQGLFLRQFTPDKALVEILRIEGGGMDHEGITG